MKRALFFIGLDHWWDRWGTLRLRGNRPVPELGEALFHVRFICPMTLKKLREIIGQMVVRSL